jgi:hypothetical protein
MHGARVRDEIESGPRVPRKEFRRQQIALQPIAAAAGEDDVARDMSASVRERMHVIERGDVEIEQRPAVDAAVVAIAHRGVLDRALEAARRNAVSGARSAR